MIALPIIFTTCDNSDINTELRKLIGEKSNYYSYLEVPL